MRYLRMLSNSVFAGLLAAVYLTLLVLHLNPSVPLEEALPLVTVMTLTYGLHTAVLSYVLYVLRHILLGEPSTPGWISLRLLTWSAAVLSGVAAVTTWLHASGLQRTLDPAAYPAVVYAAAAFAAAAGLFLLLGIAQAIARERGRATVAILFSLVTTASVVAPVMVRPEGRPLRESGTVGAVSVPDAGASGEGPRLILLCLDGASLDVISPAVAAGRLPNFGRLLDRGASMHLATTRPTHPETAWGSVLTGKWPAAHGVRAAARYRPYMGGPALEVLPDYLFSQLLVRFGFLVEERHTSQSLRARPIWSLLAARPLSAGIIGLPLTHPAEPLAGFVISDAFHRDAGRAAELDVQPAVFPPALEEAARAVLAGADEGRPAPALPAGAALLDAEAADLLEADRVHQRLLARLERESTVRLLAVRYPGLDAIGHHYAGFSQADVFRSVTEEERRVFERALGDYYGYVDALVGDAIAAMRGGDVLMVVSAFGMEPLTLGKRLLERVAGDRRVTGSHERAPDGFALAYGDAIAPGRLPRGAVVDIVPTLLYFLGLPIARDMDGSARTDMFSSAFNAPRTMTFIPTYERR